ncbi:MAG: AAA family ATPase [Bacteroidia bacterium]|nr:AAA family ATPase [Bacteroidia bacterium]
MIKIPYGISHLPTIVNEGYHFVDRTAFIEKMELSGEKTLIFLRPRRFGKSLFISTLAHYYGLEHREVFAQMFGTYYIGQHPTPKVSSYLVLQLEFSRIDTATAASTYDGFLKNVQVAIAHFLGTYSHLCTQEERKVILSQPSPDAMLKELLLAVSRTETKLCVLIDEYDHFANELLAFRFGDFQGMISRNGFVRKFYETLKTGVGQGLIDRTFITGVSPITLDSLTSGFNIGKNLSLDRGYYDMMGFHRHEVEEIITGVGAGPAELPAIMEDLQGWYNGYLFHPEAPHRLYNPDMVLYFAADYGRHKRYPDIMLDTNIASDYGKIRQILRIGGQEQQNLEMLDELITQGQISAQLTRMFNFEREFGRDDFISLLYYLGLITIGGTRYGDFLFEPPNSVIRELYYDYFSQVIRERAGYPKEEVNIREQVYQLAWHNDPAPLVEMVSETLRQLSNRDWRKFDEKHIKAILIALLHAARIYLIKSEYEASQGYVDILLLRRPPHTPPYLFAIELKYLSREKETQLADITHEARAQMMRYLHSDDTRALTNLKAWIFVFCGTECRVMEEITY